MVSAGIACAGHQGQRILTAVFQGKRCQFQKASIASLSFEWTDERFACAFVESSDCPDRPACGSDRPACAVIITDAGQRFIKPHCPWSNGKMERYNRTLATEWAYARN